jgi:hypothetical protein
MRTSMYILTNNAWVHSAALPPRYASYDVYNSYKVVVNERTPWVHNTVYRKCLNSSSQGNVNISKLVDEINSSNKYIQQLVNAKNKSDSLNMVLTNNLTRSLSREEAGC